MRTKSRISVSIVQLRGGEMVRRVLTMPIRCVAKALDVAVGFTVLGCFGAVMVLNYALMPAPRCRKCWLRGRERCKCE